MDNLLVEASDMMISILDFDLSKFEPHIRNRYHLL